MEATNINSKINTETDTSNNDNCEKQTRFILPKVGKNPAKVLTMEEIVNVLDNTRKMEIVHEIVLNPEIKLQPYEPPENSLEKAVRENMHKVFWNLLREELNRDPPCYDQAMQLVNKIKEMLPEVISTNNHGEFELINKVLDTTVLKEQIEMSVLNFRSYADFIINIIAKSCAPVRDERIRKLSKEDDIVETFKGIMETMSLMKLDMANWHLESAKQDLLLNSVEYEREKFEDCLKYYNSNFPATERWLKRNQKENKDGTVSAPEETIYNAYLELLEWNDTYEFPEILSVDRMRLSELSNEVLRLCICASVMAICLRIPIISKNLKNHTSLANHTYILSQNLIPELDIKSTLESILLQVQCTVNKYLLEENFEPLESTIENSIKSQILQLEDRESPVFKLMWDRLKIYFSLIFRTKSELSHVPPEYNDFKDQLERVVNTFHRVICYNYAVYGDYYTRTLMDKKKALKAAV